jgi:hypothetical protein
MLKKNWHVSNLMLQEYGNCDEKIEIGTTAYQKLTAVFSRIGVLQPLKVLLGLILAISNIIL